MFNHKRLLAPTWHRFPPGPASLGTSPLSSSSRSCGDGGWWEPMGTRWKIQAPNSQWYANDMPMICQYPIIFTSHDVFSSFVDCKQIHSFPIWSRSKHRGRVCHRLSRWTWKMPLNTTDHMPLSSLQTMEPKPSAISKSINPGRIMNSQTCPTKR